MRILMLHPGPSFSVADVYWGWSRAFKKLGCHVVDFNTDARMSVLTAVDIKDDEGVRRKAFSYEGAWRATMNGIFGDAYNLWPDIVFNVSGFMVSTDVLDRLRSRGHKIVTLNTESPYEDDTLVARAPHSDIVLTNDPTNLDRFRAANPRTYYQAHCYDPEIHKPGPVVDRLRSEFAFVGTGYPSRVEFFERVDWNGIDALFGGNWKDLTEDSPIMSFLEHDRNECVDNATETMDVYRSTLMSANLYRREAERDELADGWAMGPREVELAAVGVPFMTEPRGENREVLPMVPTFSGPEDFSEKLHFWLGNESVRMGVARQARAAVADRTFMNAATRLLRMVEQLPVTVPLAG
jgi:hypothetical protein